MGAKRHILYIGEYMTTDKEKIDTLINRLDNLDFVIKSFIDNSEKLESKYSFEEEMLSCNARKNVLLEELAKLGGSWPLTN